jgi:hypothetical protein
MDCQRRVTKGIEMHKSGIVLDGYQISYSKGEGIAMVGDKMYIISDATGKLSVFKKPN